jgi:hypothetical protein
MLRGLADSRRLLKKITQRYNGLKLPQQMPLIRIPVRKAVIGVAKIKTLIAYAENELLKNLDRWMLGEV